MIIQIIIICIISITSFKLIKYSFKQYRNYMEKKRQDDFLKDEIYRYS